MQESKLTLEEQLVVDWYDGIVQAIVKPLGAREWNYCSLVAWDLPRRLKIYGFFPIPQSASDQAVPLLRELQGTSADSGEWPLFQGIESELVERYTGPVDLALCDADGTVLSTKSVPADLVRPFLRQSIEGAMAQAAVDRWFSQFPPQPNRTSDEAD